MRAATIAALVLGGGLALAGCSASPSGSDMIDSYGPCSTQADCYDATFAVTSGMTDKDLAADCGVANADAAFDIIAQVREDATPRRVEAEATSGDCLVKVQYSEDGAMTGQLYDLR